MVQLRIGTVLSARAERDGVVLCVVDVAGTPANALAYADLTGAIAQGDTVIVNTTATTLGLGTGGLDIVVAVQDRERPDHPGGHAMKLRYTPLQTSVDAVEDTHRDAIDAVRSLEGLPVVVAGLHSALAPALIGAKTTTPAFRTAYVMTDASALHMGFSASIPALRDAGLLDVTFSAGQATGGDREAITLQGALAAAKAVEHADVVVVAMGPGNLGSGSRWGFASIEVAAVVNAVAAMGGRPIVVPRISFADERERHRGVSHHTVTALSLSLARATLALPNLHAERAASVRAQLEGLHHDVVEVPLTDDVERALAGAAVPLRSMGRAFADDPDYFRSGAAAGVLAATSV